MSGPGQAARSAQQVRSVRAGYLPEHGAGELLDGGREGDVAGSGGVGLPGVGEPVDQGDECLSGGRANLADVDEGPDVPADGVAVGSGLVDEEKSAGVMPGFWAESAAAGAVEGVV